ncbi:AhpC/TSA family protein [Luteibacter sp. UNC138MFCol5.1]|uniref:TlpA family protein disulfide reductase n=1 Tax=Luteibacter sp. UNC138MFCol5.1 TaxID=1502774 RepID=UPI0008ADE4B8|nr:TlpA disulfide reductase family protein [Luteibacter sp. UNC138MFCol5.1]SEO64681.1 AhpC/TSA family protein [Luteibacter sp. UNC138MFCol5.1]
MVRTLLFTAFVGLGATASAADDRRPAEASSMLSQLAVPDDYDVVFQGPDGKVIPYERFKAAMASRPFDVIKDVKAHRATLRLESDDVIAQRRAAEAAPAPQAAAPRAFPDFVTSTIDGKPVSLVSLRGKPFVAGFFFAQCAPCIAETPVLSAYHRKHPEVPVVAFTFDDQETAREFVRARGLNWPVVAGQQALIDAVGVAVYPTLMRVDAQGRVTSAVRSDTVKAPGQPLGVADLERWIGPVH